MGKLNFPVAYFYLRRTKQGRTHLTATEC